ncbi:alpha-N-acetylglucosaminidase TIM-barrel domain-containing protein [Dyadobacter jiangsuensis]|uniref:Alpha-N-acetylglucosaminidase (NAGLU)-like protein n=1 Tax=Dyadobacter jiangsuensis TaxID=1591085 RepID=A0A2P8GJ35_9BACT|nr:alpha-N-acetylglucosaminidase TIM-barrel domain-containing protein [Dyadobacter jiangsuensis]PSL33950.1 alpha-N-acetylglucosaminidase (NAGLU)-like protein [Dyadobacter jiangsuensis]
MIRGILAGIFLCVTTLSFGQELVIRNDKIQRVLSYDGQVWRTTRFADASGKTALTVRSDEFHILPMQAREGFTVNDFVAEGQPVPSRSADTSFVRISYRPKPAIAGKPGVPVKLLVTYFAINEQAHIRKTLVLEYAGAANGLPAVGDPAAVDRLEVERFVTEKSATGGGRGEPVFIGDKWFTGLEYPGGYSRHTDGNTPADYARHYEKVGNYSFIDLEGRDIEPAAKAGMVRLMHFPGNAVTTDSVKFSIQSKTAVCGLAEAGASVRHAFMQYLATVWKAPRSFLHYNNWFEPRAKDLSGQALVDIYKEFRTATEPYGVKLDAMVVDNGWQDRKSVWQPLPKFFPNGWTDVKNLTGNLRKEGVDFGFWLSLNGYVNDIDWGIRNGYHEATPNSYFKQFGRYYSLSSPAYKRELLRQVPFIVKETGAVYYKHDFNQLSDTGVGNGHPATDRHGHEANLDAAIEVLLATRKVKPDILQNLTNWVWFSPWWLMYSDYLWMLAGDDGTNGNWPEISTRAMATTDRDTFIWRMWGKATDRPLVPISRLMTHGIIKSSDGRMESKEDGLQDWLEHVLMHYGRGTLLKEWYITPSALKPEEWKALCTVDNWAKENREILNNTVYVGGRPDEGHAYGYMGWHDDEGILVARNPGAATQKLVIPFDEQTGSYQKRGESYAATVLFPYQDTYPTAFQSGGKIVVELPGYATMAFSFQKGKPGKAAAPAGRIVWNNTNKPTGETETALTVPADIADRCDLLLIGYPDVPSIKINGVAVSPARSSKSVINKFASYAKAGMISEKARPWTMQAFDLRPYKGKRITISYGRNAGFESHLLAERRTLQAPASKLTGNNLLWPITNGARRETVRLFSAEGISSAGNQKNAAEALLKRVVPSHAGQFLVEIIAKENGKDVFEIESIQNKVMLRGSNAVSVASALNWYLKYFAHCQLSWNGDNLRLPEKLPAVKEKLRKQTPYNHRAYLNYCTFNYTMTWWDWARWEREIDWMAMHGINLPLAITGQEAVWQNMLRQYGMSDDEIRSFLVGPAYAAWQWMTNIESIFGPLPQNWIDRSITLGQKILERERSLGMTPILQGFTGYVPLKLIEKQPQASIVKKSVWFHVGPGTAQLDPTDPLFAQMTQTFLEEQTRLFGTDHLYAADPFHEGEPPRKDTAYLAAVGKQIFETTTAVDPKAVIAMQTWSMRKPIVEAIPADRILMLDLNSAKWKNSGAFWGRPWVAGIIHNFGGNSAMGGDLDAVLARFPNLLQQKSQTRALAGIGMFPEASEHNPVIYEAASEMAWHRQQPDTKQWLASYLVARYGSADAPVSACWDTLLHTVYGKHGVETFRESAICARPALTVNGASPNGALNSEKNYPFHSLWPAVGLLQQASASIQKTETYRYDLVDLMRQSMADLAIPLQRRLAKAYTDGDKAAFELESRRFLDLLDDFDALLGTRQDFLLGKWIADARAIGVTEAEKDLYEKNARSLVTIWGPYHPQAIQYDYSARQWNGLVRTFYKPRWEMFIVFLKNELEKAAGTRYKEENINHRFKRPANEANDFYKMISRWEADWGDKHDLTLAAQPQGDEIGVVGRLFKKWGPVAAEVYSK